MSFSIEQVQELAPDVASAAAGRKLSALKSWAELGVAPAALWGKCQGSAVYQVKVDLSNLGYQCSCPSRKFPCKHVLGLLMLFAQSPAAVVDGEPPEWVEEWLRKRQTRQEKQDAKQPEQAAKPVDEKAKQRRTAQREARVNEGIERLDLWLRDIIRGGLAGVESQPADFWNDQAKRLVDAQAPGLASRVARLATIPRSRADWPMLLLGELGRLELLLHAWRRIEQLAPPLQSDIRQMIGWSLGGDELDAQGEAVADDWAVVGQWVDEDERIRAQRSWLVGRNTGRMALVLQFSAGGGAFTESLLPGTVQAGTLVFYPGAAGLRAKVGQREGTVEPLTARVPGSATVEGLLSDAATLLARQPWAGELGCVLHDVTLLPGETAWLVRDATGQALPVSRRDRWRLLAVTAGQPCDLFGEWDGRAVRPLGILTAGRYVVA